MKSISWNGDAKGLFKDADEAVDCNDDCGQVRHAIFDPGRRIPLKLRLDVRQQVRAPRRTRCCRQTLLGMYENRAMSL